MKKRYTEEQIIKAIKQHEAGTKVEDLCREMGISVGTFYNWRSKYAGLEVNEAKRLKELEAENNKLKKMLADKMLEVEAMKDVLSKVVTPAARKPVAQHLIEAFRLSERVACKLAGLSRTALRYQPKTNADNSIRQRLKALATQYPRYGYLMLHSLLRGEGWVKTVSIPIAFIPKKVCRFVQRNAKADTATAAYGSANSCESTLVYGLCIGSTQQWQAL